MNKKTLVKKKILQLDIYFICLTFLFIKKYRIVISQSVKINGTFRVRIFFRLVVLVLAAQIITSLYLSNVSFDSFSKSIPSHEFTTLENIAPVQSNINSNRGNYSVHNNIDAFCRTKDDKNNISIKKYVIIQKNIYNKVILTKAFLTAQFSTDT